MSFALYGPVATFTKTYTGYNDVSLKLCGDKIMMHLQGLNEFALYDLKFSKLVTLKNTYDFARIHNLTLHRLNKNPEVYSGYGDGVLPRCPKPYGTCASELERYTYGSSTTEMLCPNENCEEGNVSYIFYDAVTGKLLIGTDGRGNKLYLVDPETKTYTKWSASGAGMSTHAQVDPFIWDDNTIYVVIKKDVSPYSLEIRKYSTSEFFSNFGTGAIENYGERIYYEENSTKNIEGRLVPSFAPIRKRAVFWLGGAFAEFDFETKTFTQLNFAPSHRLGKYVLSFTVGSTSYSVVDLETMQTVQTGTTPYPVSPGGNNIQVDTPFIALYDANKIYIYLITYKNVAPVIQYDHANRRLRVVDYITGNVLNADLWVWKSRFCYPRNVYPPGITPSTMRVSDWTPVPSALKSECLTFAIKDIITG